MPPNFILGSLFSSRLWLLGMALGLGLLAQPDRAVAGNYDVAPVRIYLTPKAGQSLVSSSLVLRNTSSSPVQLQLNAFAWSQTLDGKVKLDPTEDVILFPSIVSIPSGETRNVRLGVTASSPAQEKVYRIIVEEIPSTKTKTPSGTGVNLNFLLKMSIPVFLSPTTPVPKGDIQSMDVHQGKLSFQLVNLGNAHYVAQEIKVEATNAAGQSLFGRSTAGWYVLADTPRAYSLDLPQESCKQVAALTISVKTEQNTFRQTLPTPMGICR